MKNLYVGVTLLFACRQNKVLEAVLKSFVLKSKTLDKVIEEANSLGKAQNSYNAKTGEYDFEYIGIEDIFRTVGPIADGALLGRMTIWDQSIQDAKSLVSQPDNFTFNDQTKCHSGKWYLAMPVYYVETDTPGDSRTISCYALVESKSPSLVMKKAISIAISTEFKDKIIACDLEGINKKELKFVGLEDILVVYEDIQRGGAFLDLGKRYNSIEEVRDLLSKHKELVGFFKTLS